MLPSATQSSDPPPLILLQVLEGFSVAKASAGGCVVSQIASHPQQLVQLTRLHSFDFSACIAFSSLPPSRRQTKPLFRDSSVG